MNVFKALQPRTQILNLSTRARVEGGDRVMIAGFTIGGSQDPDTKAANGVPIKVAIRGLGPSVGVSVARLGNPVIELHKSDGSIVSNDNWQEDSNAGEVSANNLAPANPSEAVLIRTLQPGAYTVILRDHDAQYGVGLIELYNLETAAMEKSRLVNISTRALVGTGDNRAIVGTITGGPAGSDPSFAPDRRIVMTAKGPSLTPLGVPGALQDPQIELRNSANVVIGSNDQHASLGFVLEEELSEVGFKPAAASESALWPTLRPAPYTAIVNGKNATSGIALIEFNEY